MARRKKRFYAVCVQKKDGTLITEVTEATTAGEALGNVLEEHHAGADPDCEWILVRSELASAGEPKPKPKAAPKPKTITKQQAARAGKAVERQLAGDFDDVLRDTGILDAYELGVAEGP